MVLPVTASEIYKWVDEKGQVHFSSHPPPEKLEQAEQVNVAYNIEAGKPAAQSSRKNTAQQKKQDEWEYLCEKAVKAAKSEYETGKEVIRKNARDGYISSARMQEQISALGAASRRVSMQECLNSSGERKRAYKCLSSYQGLHNCGFGKILF